MSLLFTLASLPLLSYATDTTLLLAPLIADETCGFEGDEAAYGIGIRLGLYLQWITTSLADNFVPDEAINMRSVNNCTSFLLLYTLPPKRPLILAFRLPTRCLHRTPLHHLYAAPI